jgi:hypothetical protein
MALFDWLFGKGGDDAGTERLRREFDEKLRGLAKERDALVEWIHYLHGQQQHHARKLDEQDAKLARCPNRAEVTSLIAQSGTVAELAARLRRVEERPRESQPSLRIETKQSETRAPRYPIPAAPAPRAISMLQEKMLRSAARYSKEFIRSKILELVRKHGQISALQLREMVVDEMGLCSRSTFYRILEELGREEDSELSAVLRKRMKVFLAQRRVARRTE